MGEARPGKFGDVVTQHRNTEGELATIERSESAAFSGEYLLCFYDEGPSGVVAPMLLDGDTVLWLAKWMERVGLATEPLEPLDSERAS